MSASHLNPEDVAEVVRSVLDILDEAEHNHGPDMVAVALGSIVTVLTGELTTFEFGGDHTIQ